MRQIRSTRSHLRVVVSGPTIDQNRRLVFGGNLIATQATTPALDPDETLRLVRHRRIMRGAKSSTLSIEMESARKTVCDQCDLTKGHLCVIRRPPCHSSLVRIGFALSQLPGSTARLRSRSGSASDSFQLFRLRTHMNEAVGTTIHCRIGDNPVPTTGTTGMAAA